MPVLWQGRVRTETGLLPLPLAPGRDEGSSPVLGVFSGMNKFFFAALALLKARAFVERNQRIVAVRDHQFQQRLVFAPVPPQFAHRAHQVGGTEIEPQLGG